MEDFDRQIFLTYNLLFLSIDEITDIGYYAAWRLSGNSVQKEMMRQTILPQIENVMHIHSVSPVWNRLYQQKIPDSFAEKTYNRCLELIAKNKFWVNDIGVQNGLAGWGLSLLSELDSNYSWTSLLPDNLTPIENESLPV